MKIINLTFLKRTLLWGGLHFVVTLGAWEYVSKPVEIEMQMTEIDGTNPSAVGLDDELNTADSFIFSVDGNSFDLECLSETAPELDEPPKVIKGKVQ